jgi:hypothetical protein
VKSLCNYEKNYSLLLANHPIRIIDPSGYYWLGLRLYTLTDKFLFLGEKFFNYHFLSKSSTKCLDYLHALII